MECRPGYRIDVLVDQMVGNYVKIACGIGCHQLKVGEEHSPLHEDGGDSSEETNHELPSSRDVLYKSDEPAGLQREPLPARSFSRLERYTCREHNDRIGRR